MPLAHPSAPRKTSDASGALGRTSVLLFVSVVICYVDRANLSVAVPLLKEELGFAVSRVGLLLSAFFWTYAFFQLVSGWLVDRYNVNWVMTAGFLVWSGATAATGLAGGFASLFLFRLLLGVGESVAYPAYAKIFATHYNEAQRGLANSLIDVGCKLGPALGTFVGGFYMAHFGWRTFFLLLGLGALPWILCWIRWMPRGPEKPGRASGPGMREILGHRSAWATFVGLFCGNYFIYFLLTWLPYYLVHERHFSMETMAVMGALPFICCASATALAGWLSYRALAAGATPTRVRKTCTVAGLGLSSMIVAVPLVSDSRSAMALLMLACASYGIFSSSPWAISQTIAGPEASGRWAGLQNFIGNLAGVVAPAVTGFVVERTGGFRWAFGLTAGVAMAGALVYLFVLGRVEPARWSAQGSS
jgi:MFS transporter, ACS family, D-galactonate transporter